MPGKKWTGEEKANIVLTTSTSTADVAGGTTSDQPWSIAGKQVSFKQVQEVYLVQMHRIEKQLEQENQRLKEMVIDYRLSLDTLPSLEGYTPLYCFLT